MELTETVAQVYRLRDGCQALRFSGVSERGYPHGFVVSKVEYTLVPGDTITMDFGEGEPAYLSGCLRFKINNGPWVDSNRGVCLHSIREFPSSFFALSGHAAQPA